MMTRQMLSMVSSGRMPRWRSHQLAHHVGLARRAERGADFLGLLDLDQPVDDVAARHQQAVDLLVDRVDLLAQFLQRGRGRGVLWTCLGHLENLGAGQPDAAGIQSH